MTLAPEISAHLLSGEELARRPDLESCELIEGRLVPMSPTSHRHALLENRLGRVLANWAEPAESGLVLCGEAGIYIRRKPDTVRAADVLFISSERYQRVTSPSYLDVAPELAVEILSPDDRWSEVTAKIADYFAAGVDRVWVVDGKLRKVFAYRSPSEVRIFSHTEALEEPEILPGFRWSLEELFR